MKQAVNKLALKAQKRHGCCACGIELADCGVRHKGDDHIVSLPDRDTIRLLHDERGAPYAADPYGKEVSNMLVSYTDEGNLTACAWAYVEAGSRVVGLGVDLVSKKGFAEERGNRFSHLLLSEREKEIAPSVYPDDLPASRAYIFSAKEASFKACAAPLRAWIKMGNTAYTFDAMEYELADLSHEQGTLRRGRAQVAMDAMGIRTIELSHVLLDEAVLTLAVALKGGGVEGMK